MIKQLCAWLAATTPSQWLQSTVWAIPTIQTIHILAIAIVLASMAMLALRLMGIAGRRQSMGAVIDSLLPWMWRALVVLLATGLLLILAEPARSLPNPVFQVKMLLLVTVLALSQVIRRASNGAAPDADIASARLLGALILLAWTGIVVAGRWIAYV